MTARMLRQRKMKESWRMASVVSDWIGGWQRIGTRAMPDVKRGTSAFRKR